MSNEVDSLRAEVQTLRALIIDTQSTIPADWRLTRIEESIFRVLLAVDIATRDALTEATGVRAYRTMGVHMSRIRAKLSPTVVIETIQGKGWRLAAREAWRALLSKPATV